MQKFTGSSQGWTDRGGVWFPADTRGKCGEVSGWVGVGEWRSRGVTLRCNLPFPTEFGRVFSGCKSSAGDPFAPNSFDQAGVSNRPAGFPFHNNPDWRQSSPRPFSCCIIHPHSPHPLLCQRSWSPSCYSSRQQRDPLPSLPPPSNRFCSLCCFGIGVRMLIPKTANPKPPSTLPHFITLSTPSSSLLLLLLTRCCLTLPRNNPPPLIPQSPYNPVNLIPSTPTTTPADPLPPSQHHFRSILPHAKPLIYSVCSNREYPRMARDSRHVEHGTNVAAVSLTLPEPHHPNPTLSHFNLPYFLQRFLF